jgi:prepilin-type N-terminal cleavage/methylation domain-containing protein
MPRPRPLPARPRRRATTRAFTLVEIMIVVGIIALIAAAALPAFRRVQHSARASAAANDLRVFATAYTTYAQQNGNFPPEAGIGVLPPLMKDSLRNSSWLAVTPIGGRYNWEYNRVEAGVRYKAAIGLRTSGVAVVSKDLNQLRALDRRIDDGNLATGNFFLGAGNEPVFILER